MHLNFLLYAAVACAPIARATLSQDLSDYLIAHPEKQAITSNDPDFQSWIAPAPLTKSPATELAVVEKAYIIQLKAGSGLTKRGETAHSLFHKRAEATIDYDTRFEFTDSSLFFGLSIQVKDDSNATTLQEIPNVVKVWPVTIFPRPNAIGSQTLSPPTGIYYDGSTNYTLTATAGKGYNANTPHKMTDVDRLHEDGIKGKGMKIAIMDTGVDYEHPALGGCFGPGCKVSFGHAFVGDDGAYLDGPDPLTKCVSGGHGTHVAGIIGMQDLPSSPFGLVGVAPEADIGMYRIFGCSGGASSEMIILAFQQAISDKVDVLSMSLGSDNAFEADEYFADIIASVEAAGIAVVIANGNNGGLAGLTSSPALSKKAIAIGSVQNSHFPTVYVGKDSKGHSFKYSGNPWPVVAPASGLKVYDMTKLAADTYSPSGCVAAAWDAASYAVQDKTDAIIAVPAGGGCSIGTKLSAASGWGFSYAVVYAVENNDDIYDQNYNFVEPQPPYYGITLNELDGKTLVQGMAGTAEYKLFFPSDVFDSHTQVTGGSMSHFTSMGPSDDTLVLKPQLSAPGEAILSIWPLEGSGYSLLSGTSMATPYAAGAFALLKSQFPSWTVQQLRERMQSTSKATPYPYDKTIAASAAQQGSGMINVYDAIHYESGVSPSELNLGDLDALKPQTITIENKSSRTKTYSISHAPLGETNMKPSQYNMGGNGSVWPTFKGQFASYATISFSATSITLKAGQTAKVTATFTPPKDTPDRYRPVYSGLITVKNNYEVYTITYLGQPYSRNKADVFDASADSGVNLPLLFPPDGTWDPLRALRDIGVYNFTTYGFPYLEWYTLQVIQYIRIDLVPYNTTFVPDFYGFDRTAENPYGVPEKYLPLQYPNATVLPMVWSDTDAGLDGSYGIWGAHDYLQLPTAYLWGFGAYIKNKPMPNGDYRALLRILRWDGDRLKKEGYQSWLSPVIRIAK